MGFSGQAILDRAAEVLGEYLPRFGGALLLVVVGYLGSRLIARVITRALLAAGLDQLAERLRVHDLLARARLERSLSRVVGAAVRLALLAAVLFAAVAQLGIDSLNEAINQGVLFLPKLLAGLALALLGAVLGGVVRERVDRASYQMALRGPLGAVAQGAVIAVFSVLALDQLGVPTQILIVLFGTVLAGALLTFALAFGLGGREYAREISAGRYVSSTFAVGEEIGLGGDQGEIVAIESASTVLRTRDGRTLRLPNHLFLEQKVTMIDAD